MEMDHAHTWMDDEDGQWRHIKNESMGSWRRIMIVVHCYSIVVLCYSIVVLCYSSLAVYDSILALWYSILAL